MGLKDQEFNVLTAYQADYNFFFRGEFVPESVLRKLTGLKIALSSEPFPRIINGRTEFTLDSINRYLDFRIIRNLLYDYVFHYDAASLPFLKWDGMLLSGEFAFPVATSVYRNRTKSHLWDIFFIGRSTTHRESHFGFLKHHYNFLHICHGVFGEALVDYMSSSKICLNVHAENEVSWEPRMQMMLACGAFVISEKVTPNSYLRPGIDYIEIGSPSELHQAVDYYLHREDERNKIAQSGHERILQVLNSKNCFKQMLSDLDMGKYKKFTCERSSTLLNTTVKLRNILRGMRRYCSFV